MQLYSWYDMMEITFVAIPEMKLWRWHDGDNIRCHPIRRLNDGDDMMEMPFLILKCFRLYAGVDMMEMTCWRNKDGIKNMNYYFIIIFVLSFNFPALKQWTFGALPLPYVPARVTRGALVAHRHSFALFRCRTSQYRRTFVPLSLSLWNDLGCVVFNGVGLAGFKSRANAFLLA